MGYPLVSLVDSVITQSISYHRKQNIEENSQFMDAGASADSYPVTVDTFFTYLRGVEIEDLKHPQHCYLLF